MGEIIKNDRYWNLHKKLINDKYDKLDKDSYNEVIANQNCPLAIKINLEVREQVEKILID
jgi:hypothetical protein